MSLGTVKWFDAKKGYGFILGPEGKDVFVHFSTIVGDGFRSLRDGEAVEYDLTEGVKGLLATEVRRTPEVMPRSADSPVPAALTPWRDRSVSILN